jgi:oxaloacetate decarboxylase alpha subunit
MTPFSQILLTQAVMNVTSPERYSVVPDELIRYAIGRFGKPTVPIEPQVMERIAALPRARELEAEPHMTPIGELRRKIGGELGKELSDEEFLLRATMPRTQVDAMLAAGPAPRHYDPSSRPAMELIRKLTSRRDLSLVSVEKPGFRLELRRSSSRVRA